METHHPACASPHALFPMLWRKSFSSRSKARSKAAWFFQFEKSGMCYLRTASANLSRRNPMKAESSPVSEFEHAHFFNGA
jgi:hypothetical protein